LDIDDPSIDTLQALLLLAVAYTAAGKGKKAYMMLGPSQAQLYDEANFLQLLALGWQLLSNSTENTTPISD
jgi:hypothetical protein